MSAHWRYAVGNAALAVLYFAAAKFGLSLAIVHPSTTAVWPPTGIAIAVLLLFGLRFWPGVLVGALAANETTNFNVLSATGIAIGNSLEAVAGAWLVNHFAGGRGVFQSAGNIVRFVVLISLLSTTISATMGVMTLIVTGSATWETFWPIWLTWWLGDTAGALIVTPLIVVWLHQPLPRLQRREALEALSLLGVTILTAIVIFSGASPLAVKKYPVGFLSIPVLVWASYRFGQRGATVAVLILGLVAVAGAKHGIGPFYSVGNPNHALLLLQAFLGTVTVSMLVLAAVVNQRQRVEAAHEQQFQQLQSIYSLADSVGRADALDTIYQQAISGLLIALRADRASVLLFDPEGVLRFKAWHGLSDAHRRMVEGHSLWRAETIYPPPIVVEDITSRSDLGVLRDLMAREGIRACAIVPLNANRRLLGQFMICYDRVHQFTAEEIQLAQTIAGHVVFAVERIRSAEELRESEAELRRMANIAPQVVWTAGIDGAITFANDRWYAYTGLTPEQNARGWPQLVLHPDDYDRCVASWGQAIRDGTEYEIEVRNRRRDGEYRWWLTRATPIKDGQGRVTSWFGSSTDIHELKLAQQALSESEDRLARSLHAANAVAWELDLRTGRLMHSNNCRSVLGIDPAEDSGATERFLERVHPEDQPMVRREIDQALDGGLTEYELNFRFIRPDDSIIWLADQAVIDRSASGAAQRMRGMIRDVTHQKEAERELALYRDHLEELVRERTDELEQLHQRLRLSERMAAMGTLAAGIGHDMGNLLLPIRMRLDALRHVEVGDDVREHVAAIAQCTTYLQSLTNGLRLFAQDPDRHDVNSSTDLATWSREVQPLYKGVVPIRIGLAWNVPGDLPPIAIAPHALTQAILNLINNAKDAIGRDQTGAVSIRAAATEGDSVAVTVQDDGPGMPQAIRSRALEPFFTTKPRQLSTGLGLSLVHGIVKSANGHIDIVSPVENGRGTAVILSIPIARTGEAAQLRHAQRDRRPLVCISIGDVRLSAMVSSLANIMECTVESPAAAPTPACNLWVTQAEPNRLEAARGFVANRSDRALILVGEAAPTWRELATVIVARACKLSDMREAMTLALRRIESAPMSPIKANGTDAAPAETPVAGPSSL